MGQHFIRFFDPGKLSSRLRIRIIFIRVILLGQFPVSLLNFYLCGGRLQLKYLIIIFEGHDKAGYFRYFAKNSIVRCQASLAATSLYRVGAVSL